MMEVCDGDVCLSVVFWSVRNYKPIIVINLCVRPFPSTPKKCIYEVLVNRAGVEVHRIFTVKVVNRQKCKIIFPIIAKIAATTSLSLKQ
jgi:hypothetical protein